MTEKESLAFIDGYCKGHEDAVSLLAGVTPDREDLLRRLKGVREKSEIICEHEWFQARGLDYAWKCKKCNRLKQIG